MQLSEAFGDSKEIEVQVGKGRLKVRYIPSSYTPAQIDSLTAENGDESQARKLAKMSADMIESWDLNRADGSNINPDADTIYNEVPSSVLTAVVRAAQKDQSAGEESAS